MYSYTYNAAGRMESFSINSVLQASYKYDAMGRQAIRTLSSPTAVTIHSVFDSEGRRIAEYNESTGALIREYIWHGWEPVAVIEGGVVAFVRADHIGRPVFATNAAGAKVWTASYRPFGEVVTSTGVAPSARFPGQWFQSESGLHQNWMRDYDPTTGRYLEPDPLGLVDGASVYGYVLQNPGRYVDPMGLNTGVGSGLGAPTPNALTEICYEACEKHHPIPSAYLTIADGGGKKPKQGLVPLNKARHKALHKELEAWMAKNCLKCIAGGVWVNAAFGGVQSGRMIRSYFSLAEIIGCLDRFWDDPNTKAKERYPDVYLQYKATVTLFRGKGIF